MIIVRTINKVTTALILIVSCSIPVRYTLHHSNCMFRLVFIKLILIKIDVFISCICNTFFPLLLMIEVVAKLFQHSSQ